MGPGHKKSLLKDFQVRTTGIFGGKTQGLKMEVIRDMFFGISILNSPYLGCEHYAKVNALPQA